MSPGVWQDMSEKITVGEAITRFLERCNQKAAFGVISIHNMPILDAFGSRGKLRFIPARGEAGALGMADAYARVTGGLGIAVTSTGTAAGNTAGAMVEALTAGSSVLHLTGQIETPYLDKDLAYIHEAPDQLAMLESISKTAFRVHSAETALSTVREAVRIATTPPTGPVSVEIPIDIQAALIDVSHVPVPLPVATPDPMSNEVDALAAVLVRAKRPLLWLGGGARGAGEAVRRLVDMGFGVVSSVQGRGIVPEDDPATLGAFNLYPEVEDFYATCDAMLVVGSRLRSNETLKYQLKLPKQLYRIDVDARAEGRCYASEVFVRGDAAKTLSALADRLEGKLAVDPQFAMNLAATREVVVARARKGLDPYEKLLDALQSAAGRDFNWVRDVTVSNSTWGNRALKIFSPRAGVHAVGGGIGQGLAMGIGAAIASAETRPRKTLCLVGDGGFILNLGELATAVQEKADMVIVLMNNARYGVIRNIQDARYGGRHYYVELHTPDYAELTHSMGVGYQLVKSLDDVPSVLAKALAGEGPQLVEIDMNTIGEFTSAFAGPPVRS